MVNAGDGPTDAVVRAGLRMWCFLVTDSMVRDGFSGGECVCVFFHFNHIAVLYQLVDSIIYHLVPKVNRMLRQTFVVSVRDHEIKRSRHIIFIHYVAY